MHKVESPADIGTIQGAGKALLLLTAPQCADSAVVRERLVRVGARNSSLLVATADTVRVPGLQKALGIQTLPAVVLYRRGHRISEITGRATGQQLQALVDSVLW